MANIDKSFNLNLDDDDIEITDEQLANDADFDIDDFDSLEDEESLNREETKEEAGKVKDEDSEIDEDSDDSSKHTVNNNFFKGLVAKEDDEELDDDIEDEDEDDSDISSDSKLSSIASIKDSNIFADNKQNIEDEEDEDEEDEDEDEADEDEDDEDDTHREKDPLDSAILTLDDADTKEVDDTGTEVNLDEEGLSQKLDEKIVTDSDFIDSSGGIVVQDKDDDGHGFTFAYIDKDNIAVQTDSRIHKDASLTALQKSIQNTGILEPLVVAPLKTAGYYILIHGYRRFKAGLREGLKQFPCIINNRIKTNEIPIIEAIYNHNKTYTVKELKEYINYLEKDKGILSASMIEFLCQLNSGDYAKLRDLWDDNDPDILEKLESGQFTIQQAFNALEKRRKKETKAEQESKAAEKAYSGDKDNVLNEVGEAGDVGDQNSALSDDEIKEMSFDPTKLDDIIEEKELDDMVSDGKDMEGFEPHKQDPNNRERIDPSIRKAVMSRDNNTCQCCKRGGPDYVDILDLHHIVEVYLGGEDSVENSIALCLNCHKQVHLYAFNKLHIPKTKSDEELKTEVEKEIVAENARRKEKDQKELTDEEKDVIRDEHITLYKNEQNKYKRIIYLGNIIREGMRKKGMKLEQAKKEHPIDNIGRQKPGIKNTIA